MVPWPPRREDPPRRVQGDMTKIEPHSVPSHAAATPPEAGAAPAPRRHGRHREPPLALLVVILASVQLGMTMYIPSLPAIAADFNVSAAVATLTLTVYLAFFAISQLVVGPLSDRFGRRPVVLGGVAAFVIASFACAAAPTIELLIAMRAVQATGACCVIAVSRAIVRDMYSREDSARALSVLGSAMGVTPAVGPILGGKLQVWFGWSASFYVMAAVAAVGFVLALFLLGETRRHVGAPLNLFTILRNYAALVRVRAFMGFSLTMGLATATFQAFIAGAPIVLITLLGVAPDDFAFYTLVWPLAFTVGNFISSRLTLRLGMERLILIGNLVSVAAATVMVSLALAGVFTVAAIIVPALFLGMGNGLVSPNAMAGAVSERPDIAGAAAAMAGFLQMGMGAGLTIAVGLLHEANQLPWSLIIFATALCGLWVCGLLGPRGGRGGT
jgi:DHA1 family bicyclomycin/chloramphenicol resistance-like MFS transporter